MKTKGANGPLTLRCPKCGARNVGDEHPIQRFGDSRRITRNGRSKTITPVRCCRRSGYDSSIVCGNMWLTTHSSVQTSIDKISGGAK